MTHRGKIVEDKIAEIGRKHNSIYEKLKVSRQTFRNWLDSPNLEFDKIIRIGKIIGHDFSAEFKEIDKYLSAEDPVPQYANATLKVCIEEKEAFKKEAAHFQDLYLKAMNELLFTKDQLIKTKDQLIQAMQK
jgi:hypothetical protein